MAQTQTQTQTAPVLFQPKDLGKLDLNPVEQGQLLLALNTTLLGTGRVTVCFTYRNQTDSARGNPGVDYVALPGVSRNTMIGQIIKVGRNKKDGTPYFTLDCLTRGDGVSASKPRSFKPAGVMRFAITGFAPVLPQANEGAE